MVKDRFVGRRHRHHQHPSHRVLLRPSGKAPINQGRGYVRRGVDGRVRGYEAASGSTVSSSLKGRPVFSPLSLSLSLSLSLDLPFSL